ncbi:hypothetical protein ACFE04_013070 [Oxalis oulophora]
MLKVDPFTFSRKVRSLEDGFRDHGIQVQWSGVEKKYRGTIRPSPPPLDVSKWRLHYGLCVDAYHQDGWWEGVIFYHNDNSEERNGILGRADCRGYWEKPKKSTINDILVEFNISETFEKKHAPPVQFSEDNLDIIIHDIVPVEDLDINFHDTAPFEDLASNAKSPASIEEVTINGDTTRWVIERKKMTKSKRNKCTYRSQSRRIYQSLRKARERCIKDGEATESSGSMVHRDLVPSTDESKHESRELSIASKLKTLKLRKGKPKGFGKFNKKSAFASCRLLTRLKAKKSSKKEAAPSSSPSAPPSMLAWLIECNILSLGDPLYYPWAIDRSLATQGKVVRDGIKCLCCGWCFTVSGFETHANSMHHKQLVNKALEYGCTDEKPSTNVVPEAVSNQDKGQNDNVCSIRHYGREGLLCEDCLGLKDIPDGDWFCPSCCCEGCGGILFKEDGTRTVEDKVVNCYQCGTKYHMKCLDHERRVELENRSTVDWFCSERCEEVSTLPLGEIGSSFFGGRTN